MRKKKFALMSLSVILLVVLAAGMASCHAGSGNPTETTGATTAGTTEATVSESAEATTAATTAATEITTAPTEAATVATEAVTEPATSATEPEATAGETVPAVKPTEATKATEPKQTEATKATEPASKPTAPKETEPASKPTEPKQNEATTAPTIKPTEATKPAHKHSYTAKVTKAATCTAAGTKTFSCSCGDSYTESIPATGHSYTSKVVAPTTSAKGYTQHTCSKCGNSYKDSYTDKLPAATTAPTTKPTVPKETEPASKPTEATKPHAHSYTAKVTKAATCTAAGTKTYICSCGDSYTESIEKTAHDMVKVNSWSVYPDSLYEYECSHGCGESYICNKQGKIAEKLNIAKLEAYGRKYAEDAYGYDGNSKCNPSTNAGYNPGIQQTIYTMEEGYELVRWAIDNQYDSDMYYGYPIWMEIDGEIVRQCVNIDFRAMEAPNTYIVIVYYGGEADPEP